MLPQLESGKIRRQETGTSSNSSRGAGLRRSSTSKDVVALASSELTTPRSGPTKRVGVGSALPSLHTKASALPDALRPSPRSSERNAIANPAMGYVLHNHLPTIEALYTELVNEMVKVEIYEACRNEVERYIHAYHLPDDGLNLEEHLWMDVATPVVAKECTQVLKECFQKIAQEYIVNEWAERILNELLQDRNNVVVSTAAQIAEQVLDEHRVEVAATELMDEVVTAMIQEVVRTSYAEAKDVSSEMMEDEDFALVNANAADAIMYSIATRHLLGLLATHGVIWDFEEFCTEDFANKLFGEAILQHIRVIQECILEKPYWGTVRGLVATEVATDYLLEQLSISGSHPPASGMMS